MSDETEKAALLNKHIRILRADVEGFIRKSSSLTDAAVDVNTPHELIKLGIQIQTDYLSLQERAGCIAKDSFYDIILQGSIYFNPTNEPDYFYKKQSTLAAVLKDFVPLVTKNMPCLIQFNEQHNLLKQQLANLPINGTAYQSIDRIKKCMEINRPELCKVWITNQAPPTINTIIDSIVTAIDNEETTLSRHRGIHNKEEHPNIHRVLDFLRNLRAYLCAHFLKMSGYLQNEQLESYLKTYSQKSTASILVTMRVKECLLEQKNPVSTSAKNSENDTPSPGT